MLDINWRELTRRIFKKTLMYDDLLDDPMAKALVEKSLWADGERAFKKKFEMTRDEWIEAHEQRRISRELAIELYDKEIWELGKEGAVRQAEISNEREKLLRESLEITRNLEAQYKQD